MLEVDAVQPTESEREPIYEITDNFSELTAVGLIILDPLRERILLVRRLVNEFEENPDADGNLIPMAKEIKNKVDQRDKNIILTLPSGSGPLSDNPGDPDLAARKEIFNETQAWSAFLWRFHTYKRTDIPGGEKVGFYVVEMSPNFEGPRNEHKDLPGWWPIKMFGKKINIPYEEHNRVVMDFIKEWVDQINI